MLERLFTSRTRIRILELFILNPEKDFHLRDIARKTKTTPIYVSKELKNLEKAGLVSSWKRANLTLFKIRKESPIYDDVKRMFLKTEVVGNTIRSSLKGLNTKYALIYGSFAKGEEIETSDIDLFIIGDVKEDAMLTATKKLEQRTGREINYILWTEEDFIKKAEEKHSLLVNIIKNPIIMLIGDLDDFRRNVKR